MNKLKLLLLHLLTIIILSFFIPLNYSFLLLLYALIPHLFKLAKMSIKVKPIIIIFIFTYLITLFITRDLYLSLNISINGLLRILSMFIIATRYTTGKRKIFGLQTLSSSGTTINYMTFFIRQECL